ncbi:hypothetical protein JRO89_XS08G0134400 [Xanthoceras sorbifolium]|uniref:Kinesin-like protein n=1 Tax=Xanthoceras sorbifolium TaxID=99658 RepID=A0ABQ8HPL7_9ROSI|nr:hypothetical protein JRO89_XS08G0134400 [Xanthoceras sorbifolium]
MGVADEEEPMQGPSGQEERILVSVRLRPLNEKEIARNDVSDWECINDNTIIYRNNLSVAERSMYPTAYTFDRVFSPDCITRKVYEEGAKEVALSVVSGINSSVFAYGQTSSGKTYTMSGITEYTMADIYDYIEKHKERNFTLKFSALEIYNESVRDLLSADSTPLRLLDDPERGTIVEKLTEETLRDWSHFKELLSICEAQRQIGETSLNETSSRSHQILRLTIESSAREFLGKDKSSSLTATVNFIDLAGSERASQALSAGARLKEGCHINRSLLTLGTVIRKLSKGRNGHIPFRDSKLTRILQSSLGGNARTAIICTLSPARIHVEQSRNTLLFASCAKEVATNAQVNIVMSDKALVKHLQRELARLENELRSPGPNSGIHDSATLLREKDIEIETLKKEVTELALQLDLARSQVEDLLRGTANDTPASTVSVDLQYPKLRVRNSWDFENQKSENPVLSSPFDMDLSVRSPGTYQYSDGDTRSSADENFFQLLDFEENFSGTSSLHQHKVGIPSSVDTDLHEEEIEAQNDENLEELCRVVRCIEMEGSINADSHMSEFSPSIYGDSKISSSEANPVTLGLTEVENEDKKTQEFGSLPAKEKKEWKNIHPDSVISSSTDQSPWMLVNDSCSHSSLKLSRSRSCKASLMISSYSPFENDEKNESTPPIGYAKHFTGRPGGIPKKFSALKYAVEDGNLSRNGSQSSGRSADTDELKAQNTKTSNASENTSVSAIVAQMDEKTDPQKENQLPSHPDSEPKPVGPAKNVRDVGLDPIIDDFVSPLTWALEFKRLQREIIELWHACNVSLVHRSYFFLLFKGDPKDSVYMEVEHRRVSFLKDSFSRGNQTVADGKTVTPASSMKALRQERQMLYQQMEKKLSKEQRENLFLKWGIGLQTKYRRLQLAHSLWSDTKDMNHIAESASVVAKLVGFVKPEQAFKEMFGLNFAPRRKSRKFKLWKSSGASVI